MLATKDSNLIQTPLTAFDKLRAEDEPWLAEVFEPPPGFDLMTGARSAVIVGGPGSGKTAVYQALIQSSVSAAGKPERLLVNWYPTPLHPGVSADSHTVQQQLIQILDACAMSLLAHIGYYPKDFGDAPDWAKETLRWFVQRNLQGDFKIRTGALAEEFNNEGRALLDALDCQPALQVLHNNAPAELVLAELVKGLKAINLEGAWILVDGLETWSSANPEPLAAGLNAFLSALNLFERSGFAYKLLFSSTLYRTLGQASGIKRHRIDTHRLSWSMAKLKNLVEKRLSFATQGQINSLADLCDDKGLIPWLEHCGGHTPRGWLEFIRPLVAAYFEQTGEGNPQPITAKEWQNIRKRHPPLLILNEEQHQITVGWREITDLPVGPYTLLKYLYKRAGQICTKSELYYLAYLGLEKEPLSHKDDNWVSRKTYEGLIDTNIWRLRKAIEPIPKKPLFIVTVKGQGIRLENAW